MRGIGPLTAEGGIPAPLWPRYHAASAAPEGQLRRVTEVLNRSGWAPLNASNDQLEVVAEELWEAAHAFTVLDALPPVSARRGGIAFARPPEPLVGWHRWTPKGLRPRWREWSGRNPMFRWSRARRTQLGRFRKRVADTRAVWAGRKDAYSEAEIDRLVEE